MLSMALSRFLFQTMTPLQLIKYLPLVCFLGIVFSVCTHYNRYTNLDEGYYLVLFETDSKIAPHLRKFNQNILLLFRGKKITKKIIFLEIFQILIL